MTVAPLFFSAGIFIALLYFLLVLIAGGGALWFAGCSFPKFKVSNPIKNTVKIFFLAVGIKIILLILQAPVLIALNKTLFNIYFMLLLLIASFIVYLIKVEFDGPNSKRIFLSFILAGFTSGVICFFKELFLFAFKSLIE